MSHPSGGKNASAVSLLQQAQIVVEVEGGVVVAVYVDSLPGIVFDVKILDHDCEFACAEGATNSQLRALIEERRLSQVL